MHKLLNDRGFVAKAAVLAACACLLSFPTAAQFRTTEQRVELSGALSDIQTNSKTYDFGKKTIIAGLSTAAVGGGLIALGFYTDRNYTGTDSGHDNIGSALAFALGVSGLFTGTILTLAGIPIIVSGKTIRDTPGDWKDFRYNDNQRGPGVIVSLAGSVPWAIGASVEAGYHFNRHFFCGAGVSPTVNIDSVNGNGSPLYLPIYADVRCSFINRMLSPYAGIAAGYDIIDQEIYLGTDLGLRIRRSQQNARSMWASLSGEVSGSYMRLGIKMGYSF